ncbi:MAG TPA: VCBS repeat-containing protein, partial [Polyangiaceae bacterium]
MKGRLARGAALAMVAIAACNQDGTVLGPPPVVESFTCGAAPAAPAATSPSAACRDEPLEDATAAWGIDVVHHSAGACVPQVIGPGGCMLDYDGDCDLDLVLFPGVGAGATLLRNDGGRFSAIPGGAGLSGSFNGLGCLAFDYDGDHDVDLFFTTTEGQRLFRNDGASFVDVTSAAGLAYPHAGASATAGDVDGDGDLDLFVAGFVDGARCDYPCEISPNTCVPQPDTLWMNQGGSFVEAAVAHGIVSVHTALAVRFFDFDRDGDLDLWIGSDLGNDPPYYPIQLWLNDGTGEFTEVAAQRGLALAANGHSGDVMGVDIADFDLDGVPDVVASSKRDQPLLFFRCDASGSCADRSSQIGLAPSSAFFK